MKFKYSLQSVLDFKKELENLSRLHLGEMIFIYNKRSAEMENQRQKRTNWMAKWQEKSRQGIDGDEYFLGQIFNEHWRGKIKILEQEKWAWAKKVELEKERLKSIRQEKEILEKLRVKKWKQFCRELNKMEQKINDEITIFKYNPLLKG